jgi:ATP-binding cassette subfamily B multidrug efflux pump
VRAPLMMIGGIVMAVDTDAKLSLVFVVIMPLLAAVILLVMRRGVRLFQEVQRRVDVFNRVVRENLAGVRVVRAFDRTDDETERLLHANQDLTLVSTQVFRLMATLMPLLMLIINGSTIAILWFGGQGVRTGAVEVGNLMAFIQYATQIMMSIMMVSMMFFMWPLTPGSTRGEVAFTGVSFRYPGADATVLEDITFRCRRGEWTAIVGGIGSGKSTLVSLLLRFFDVTAGTITVDGVDVRALDQATLRQKIGFVPQRSVLFSGTVAENIRFGAPTASDADVRRAAEIAQAVEFIEALPEGYDTRLSQGGTNLSGGQRQRLAIARALVRRPEIYVFDESFSALDYRTDALLRAALRREIGDATVIVVTQRVSTALDADQIVVLDEGRIAGIGTHASLLESCEVYREIVASQMEKEATA